MHDFLRMKRPDDPRVFLEQIAKAPDREKCRRPAGAAYRARHHPKQRADFRLQGFAE